MNDWRWTSNALGQQDPTGWNSLHRDTELARSQYAIYEQQCRNKNNIDDLWTEVQSLRSLVESQSAVIKKLAEILSVVLPNDISAAARHYEHRDMINAMHEEKRRERPYRRY